MQFVVLGLKAVSKNWVPKRGIKNKVALAVLLKAVTMYCFSARVHFPLRKQYLIKIRISKFNYCYCVDNFNIFIMKSMLLTA